MKKRETLTKASSLTPKPMAKAEDFCAAFHSGLRILSSTSQYLRSRANTYADAGMDRVAKDLFKSAETIDFTTEEMDKAYGAELNRLLNEGQEQMSKTFVAILEKCLKDAPEKDGLPRTIN